MNEKLIAIKAALTAACTALGAFLGWKGIMAIVLAYVQQQPEIRYAYAIDGSYVHMDVQ